MAVKDEHSKAKATTAVVALILVVGLGGTAIGDFLNRADEKIKATEKADRCLAMEIINQCFSDPMCTRTSNDYARRAELERLLGNTCEVPK